MFSSHGPCLLNLSQVSFLLDFPVPRIVECFSFILVVVEGVQRIEPRTCFGYPVASASEKFVESSFRILIVRPSSNYP